MSKPKIDLPTALAKMDKAVAALDEPHLEYRDSRLLKTPSLLEQLRASVYGMQGTGNGHAARSMPPVWIDAVSVLSDIEDWCSAWKITAPAELPGLEWTPERIRDIQKITRDLESMAKRISQLLDPPRKFTISAPCPECGATTAKHIDSAGDEVNGPALNVVPSVGCTCLECGTFWPPSSYQLLASVLQLPLPAGVTE